MAPAGQPEVLRFLDRTIGNRYFLHIVLPLVVSLNGWAHMNAVLPSDTYWLPGAYWAYSMSASISNGFDSHPAVSLPLLVKTRPRSVWQIGSAIHFVNGFLYSQVIGHIWRCDQPSLGTSLRHARMRKQAEEKQLLTEGEELEAKFIKRE